MTKKWKVGDKFWRGYARTWDHGQSYVAEIRPGHVCRVNDDGSFKCIMVGTMPGTEGKRTPGFWIAYSLDADLLVTTPELALVQAKTVTRRENRRLKSIDRTASEGKAR